MSTPASELTGGWGRARPAAPRAGLAHPGEALGRWRRRRARAGLAEGYVRVVRCAETPRGGRGSRVPVKRGAVRRCRHELLLIAELLRAPGEPSAAATAAARALLCDPTGPLYLWGDLDASTRLLVDLLQEDRWP